MRGFFLSETKVTKKTKTLGEIVGQLSEEIAKAAREIGARIQFVGWLPSGEPVHIFVKG